MSQPALMKNRFPIYVVSKGRYQPGRALTARALQHIGADFYLVIEKEEYELYAQYFDESILLVVEQRFKDEYETLDDLGDTKSKGPGPARNFAWDHSIRNGYEWHWVMDDNITKFYRLNRDRRTPVDSCAAICAMEDFTTRYVNVGMSGPAYQMFVIPRTKWTPFVINTHIYSCNLIRNSMPHRWRGRYNEDTDLSIMMMRDGWNTIQFKAFLQKKVATQTIKGGNTDNFYAAEGTYLKSKMLVDTHPDLCRLVQRYGRWHHHCDYSRFKKRKLVKRKDFKPTGEPNEYGMVFKHEQREK